MGASYESVYQEIHLGYCSNPMKEPKRHQWDESRIQRIEQKISESGEESLTNWESRYYKAHCEEILYNYYWDCQASEDL